MRFTGRWLIFAGALLSTAAIVGNSQAQNLRPDAMYVVGPGEQVDRGLAGETVRACAPFVDNLPGNFTQFRTPPREMARAISLGLCEVLVAGGDEVEGYLDDLADLGISAEVATLDEGMPVAVESRPRHAEDTIAGPGPSLRPPGFGDRPDTVARMELDAPRADTPGIAISRRAAPPERTAPRAETPPPRMAGQQARDAAPPPLQPEARVADLPPTRPDSASELFYGGFEALRAGQPDVAAELFEDGLALEPDNVSATYYLGVAYDHMGFRQEAVDLYQRAVEIAPRSPEAAEARERLGRADSPAPLPSADPIASLFRPRHARSHTVPRPIETERTEPPGVRQLFEHSPGLRLWEAAKAREQGRDQLPPLALPAPRIVEAPTQRAVPPRRPAQAAPGLGLAPTRGGLSTFRGRSPAPPVEDTADEPPAVVPPPPSPEGVATVTSGMRPAPRVSRRGSEAVQPPAPARTVGMTSAEEVPRQEAPPPAARPREAAPTEIRPGPAGPSGPLASRSRGSLPTRFTTDRPAPQPERSEARPSAPREAAGAERDRDPQPATAFAESERDQSGIRIARRASGRTEEAPPRAETRSTAPATLERREQSPPSAPAPPRISEPNGPEMRLVFPDGATYEGRTTIVDGEPVPHGRGSLTYADGSRYTGAFRSGLRHGLGTLSFEGGWRYEGEFVDDRMSGHGTLVWPDGARYTGTFVEGERTGEGVYVWPNGARYEGEFVRGTIQGTGTLRQPDGREVRGVWQDGELVQPS